MSAFLRAFSHSGIIRQPSNFGHAESPSALLQSRFLLLSFSCLDNTVRINQQPRNHLARINADGSLDTTFRSNDYQFYSAGNEAWGTRPVFAVAVQPDGKILFGGEFLKVDRESRSHIARLNADGSLDETFVPTPGTSESFFDSNDFPYTGNMDKPEVCAIALDSDGQILLGGNFNQYNGKSSLGVARLKGGSLAAALPKILMATTNITQLAGGKIRLAAQTLSATPVTYQWELNGLPIAGETNSVLQVAHASVTNTGNYTLTASNSEGTATGSPVQVLVKPNPAPQPGNLDPEFSPEISGVVYTFSQQPDGKILLGGDFSAVDGVPAIDLVRINHDRTLDTSFQTGTGSLSKFSGIAYISSVAVQKDGKILIGGSFNAFDGAARNGMARLNPDGSVDGGFDPGQGATLFDALNYWPYANEDVTQISPQDDGKIVIAGHFNAFGGVNASSDSNGISHIRLNADGSVDTSYKPANALSSLTWRQSDGRILYLGGSDFMPMLERRSSNGEPDLTFKEFPILVAGFLTLQPDDKIITLDWNPAGWAISRHTSDGQPDESFHSPILTGRLIYALQLQSDGSIMIVGGLDSVDSVTRFGIARLLGDTPNTPRIENQPDNRLTYAGQKVQLSIEISSASSAQFQWQLNGQDIPGATNRVFEIATVQASQAGDYRVVIRNSSGSVTSDSAHLTVFATPAGTLDRSFSGGTNLDGAVNALYIQPDGKLLVGGSFTNAGGKPYRGVARLESSGSLDPSFDPGTGISGPTNVHVRSIVGQPDGKLLIGGQFESVSGIQRSSAARLNPDGSLDESFHPTPAPDRNRLVKSLALQPDGQVLVGGVFNYTTNLDRYRHLVRLSTSGLLDTNYSPNPLGSGSHYIYSWDYSSANALIPQSDGKTLVAGGFLYFGNTYYIGSGDGGIVKLNANGSISQDFRANMFLLRYESSDMIPILNTAVQQPDGKVLVAGLFNYIGISSGWPYDLIYNLDRLNSDGSRDTSFNAKTNLTIYALATQADGKILIGGSFESTPAFPRKNIARLNPDGTLDDLFDVGAIDGVVNAITILSDGSIVLGGAFTHINGVEQHGLAKLNPNPVDLPALTGMIFSQNALSFSWPTANGKIYVLESTTSLSSPQWVPVSTHEGDNSMKSFTDDTMTDQHRFYRLRVQEN